MSWWTDARDKWEQAASLGLYDPASSRHKEADQRYAINEQIQAYKDQTALTQKEIETARNEKAVEKRKVNEKQIRALRNNYRGANAGFLNNQAPQSNSLGGAGNLSNKLGS